jgi:hypothetical protein
MDPATISKLFVILIKLGICTVAGPFQAPNGDTLQVIVCPTIQPAGAEETPADPSTTEPTPPVVKPRRTWSL